MRLYKNGVNPTIFLQPGNAGLHLINMKNTVSYSPNGQETIPVFTAADKTTLFVPAYEEWKTISVPLLNITGMNEGYSFSDEEVIRKINAADPDILIIGLSCPKQERWICDNRDKINFKVALNVGDGIKVFAGYKVRGPEIFRKAGMEWLFRLFSDPVSNFNKYVTGIPLFIYRIFKEKLKKLK